MAQRLRRLGAAVAVAVAVVVGVVGCGAAPKTALRVSANHLVIGAPGRTVQLRGINRSGTEYKCVQGLGYFDSPTPNQPDSDAMVTAMTRWDVNVVRLPLNEGCWLGEDAPSSNSGAAYRQAIAGEIKVLEAHRLFVILSLQWIGPGSGESDLQPPMADEAHAPAFWRSVAATFAQDSNVMFDLYNEPFNITWSCWLHGCQVPAGSGSSTNTWPAYQSAGMQQLVTAVRKAGATQPLLLGGLHYSLDLSGWLAHEPKDPDHNLVASIHSYGGLSPCTGTCLSAMLSVAQKVPVVFGELGETDCQAIYIDQMMQTADTHGIGYLGWAWDATDGGSWTCNDGPALISDYTGTPTGYGAGFQEHMQELGQPVRPAAPKAGAGN